MNLLNFAIKKYLHISLEIKTCDWLSEQLVHLNFISINVFYNSSYRHMSGGRLLLDIHGSATASLVCKDDQSEPLCICLATIILSYLTVHNDNFQQKM